MPVQTTAPTAPLYRTVVSFVSNRRGGVALSPRRTAVGGFGGVNASRPFIHTVKAQR